MVRIAGLALTLMVAACGILEPEIEGTGTVEFDEVEGGCWSIVTASTRYAPTNLPANLRVDGLRVNFEASHREDIQGFCPGQPIELIWIEAAPTGDGEG